MMRLQKILEEFDAQLTAVPSDVDARANRAHALQLMGRYDAAEIEFEAVLKANPNHPNALTNYCKLLEHGTDGLARIEVLCRRALATQPKDLVAMMCLAKALLVGLRVDEGLKLMEAVLQPPLANGLLQRELLVTYLFYLGYSDQLSSECMTQSLSDARQWLEFHFAHYPDPQRPTSDSDVEVPERGNPVIIRVGVLCADAYRHPVGQLLAAFLPHLDKERVEVMFYDLSPRSDEVTQLLQASTNYVAAHGESVEQLVRRVRKDNIDVLLDTASLTHPVIFAAVARRCAPVQLSWGGWVYSHPLATIDGFIADEITVPDGVESQFLQPVYRLPYCVYSYRPLEPRPEPAPLPALRNGFLTFGSFNHLAKVNAKTLDIWAAVLRALPNARMVVKAATVADVGTRERLAQAMADRGIAVDRLIMCLPSQYGKYLEDFGRVDIALDCFPFNGGMTTIDGLWQGVPLLALSGDTHASRVGASLMRAAGLPEWVAENVDDYVALACHMSADLNALAGLRKTLPERLTISPLGNVHQYASAMTDIWIEASKHQRKS